MRMRKPRRSKAAKPNIGDLALALFDKRVSILSLYDLQQRLTRPEIDELYEHVLGEKAPSEPRIKKKMAKRIMSSARYRFDTKSEARARLLATSADFDKENAIPSARKNTLAKRQPRARKNGSSRPDSKRPLSSGFQLVTPKQNGPKREETSAQDASATPANGVRPDSGRPLVALERHASKREETKPKAKNGAAQSSSASRKARSSALVACERRASKREEAEAKTDSGAAQSDGRRSLSVSRAPPPVAPKRGESSERKGGSGIEESVRNIDAPTSSRHDLPKQPVILKSYLAHAEFKLPADSTFPDVRLPNVSKKVLAEWKTKTAAALRKDLEKIPDSASSTKCMNPNWHATSKVLSEAAGTEVRVFCKREERKNNEVYSQLVASKWEYTPFVKLIVAYHDGSERETLVFPLLIGPKGKFAELNGPGIDMESGIEWRSEHDIGGWSERVVRLRILLPLLKLLITAKKHGFRLMDFKTQNLGNLVDDRTDVVVFDLGVMPLEESPTDDVFTPEATAPAQLLGKPCDASMQSYCIAVIGIKALTLECPFGKTEATSTEDLIEAILDFQDRLPAFFVRLTTKFGVRPALAALLCQVLSQDGGVDLEWFRSCLEDLSRPEKHEQTHRIMTVLCAWTRKAAQHEKREQEKREWTTMREEHARMKDMLARPEDTKAGAADELAAERAARMCAEQENLVLKQKVTALQEQLDATSDEIRKLRLDPDSVETVKSRS